MILYCIPYLQYDPLLYNYLQYDPLLFNYLQYDPLLYNYLQYDPMWCRSVLSRVQRAGDAVADPGQLDNRGFGGYHDALSYQGNLFRRNS